MLEEYAKSNGNAKRQTVGEYVYDETNKMVKGTNSSGESSSYLFNGLNALVEQTLHIAENGYGYHDVDAGTEESSGNGSGGKGNGNGGNQGDKPTGSAVTSFSTVIRQFVIDYTRETMDPLMEHEVNGLDYRYVYGNERLSVNISPISNGAGHVVETGTMGQQIRLYYHQDMRGTVDYLTSPTTRQVEGWTHYNEWGEITHKAVLSFGLRELDLVKNYTGHDFDPVLNLYYAKARMYDAENRRFTSVDPILNGSKYDLREYASEVINFTAYLYVRDNPLRWIDPLGLKIDEGNGNTNKSPAYIAFDGDGGGSGPSDEAAVPSISNLKPENVKPSVQTPGVHTEPAQLSYLEAKDSYTPSTPYATGLQASMQQNSTERTSNLNQPSVQKSEVQESSGYPSYLETKDSYTPSTPYAAGLQANSNSNNLSSKVDGELQQNKSRFIGFGVQLEISMSIAGSPIGGSVGIEIVYYCDDEIRRNIDCAKYVGAYGICTYIYYTRSASASTKKDATKVAMDLFRNPSILTHLDSINNILGNFSGSISLFAIMGNDQFSDASDYRGMGSFSLSLTLNHIKGYVAWGTTCTCYGVGVSTEYFSCGLSIAGYDLLGDGFFFDIDSSDLEIFGATGTDAAMKLIFPVSW